jgi:zinc transport system ATP-binding protein
MSGLINKKGLRPFFNKEEKNIAKKNMERLGIWDIRKKPFCELSGGQQQKVLLARALCAGNEILFLDEPVTGLDHESTHVFYKTVSELNKDGISIFMVSHDLSLAIRNAKQILYLGKENFFGTVEDFKNTDIFYKI